ncbi:MFS transporter [Kineococcus gynurae]|uniref:MFS transporter n=1 Tax=Kineococcus gynurae TaxID=452979 RepID=A0ABV5LQ56_9ACTN
MSTPFAEYRVLPAVAGRSFLPVTFLARLSATMLPLAMLTFITAERSSIAVGGLVAAGTAVGQAVGPPLAGALADRRGQRGILLALVPVHVLTLLALAAVAATAAEPALVALAWVAGLTLPAVGPMSRARWMRLAPDRLRTALALEGTLDEAGFIAGPALVGLLSLPAGPRLPIVVAAGLTLVFVTAFALHPSAVRAHAERPAPAASRPRTPVVAALVPFVGMVAMGAIFGATQASVTATAAEAGRVELGPLVYALMAIGSTITTLCLVLVPGRIGLWRRWGVIALGLVAGGLALLLAPGLGGVTAAVALLGLFVGPALVTINSVAAERIDLARGGAVMALLGSGVVVGVALGAALAGSLAEGSGPAAGFAVVLAAALVQALLVAGHVLGGVRTGRRGGPDRPGVGAREVAGVR